MKSLIVGLIVAACLGIAILVWRSKDRDEAVPHAVASVAVEAASAPAAEDEPWRAEAREAAARGTAWLIAHQGETGAWSDPRFPALSGLALWALTGSRDAAAAGAIDRAVAYLLTCVQTNGGIYAEVPGRKGGGLSNYNTAICLTALHATGRRELTRVLQNARTFLAASQYAGADEFHFGGFGYDHQNQREYTDLMNTHYAVEAMGRTQDVEDRRPAGEARADVNWEHVLRYVGRLQAKNEDGADHEGGFVYNPIDPKAGVETNASGRVVLRAYGSITYAGLMAMLYSEVPRDDPRVISAVDYAARHWTLDENPGMGSQGLFFYYNVIARALTAGRMEAVVRKDGAGEPIRWRADLARKLATLQNPDGSWTNANNRFWENDPVLATAYALLALQLAAGGK
jgi:squalene-hopene/tetraprenyl-beta-curcumene cyclase